MNRLSLKLKLVVGFGSLILVIFGMCTFSFFSTRNLADLGSEVTRQMRKVELAYQVDYGYEMQTNGARTFLLTGDEAALKRHNDGIAQTKDGMDELGRLLQTVRGKAMYESMKQETIELQAVQDSAIALRRSGNSKAATELLFSAHALEIRGDLDRQVEELRQLTNTLQQQAEADRDKAGSQSQTLMITLAVIGLLIGLAVATLIARSITASVSHMQVMIEEVANKNLTIADMVVTTEDDLGKAAMALNQMKNSLHAIVQSISETAQHVAAASEELSSTSQQISANSEETSVQAGVVSQAAKQVNSNLQSVSTGSEEMTSTIQSIASNAHEAATFASNAVQTAQAANATVQKLGESSAEIGEVTKVITSIAQQTNLLALNATIEAARAGEAGKGFAVVANEVKELAKQTAKATEDISRKIMAIQTDTKGAVDAIGTITGVIGQINDISGTIATAVEEQSATTNEMTRNVADAAKGSGEITHNIAGVAEAARETSTRAQESQKAADELAEMAVQLHGLMGQFKVSGTASTTAPPAPKGRSAHAGA